MPARIETLEAEERRLQAAVSHPEFYKEPANTIADTMRQLEAVQAQLLDAYGKWDELQTRSGG